ncbi:MAG: 4Fe-4S dicluster domain-containing protein [Chromatiales bacterium]
MTTIVTENCLRCRFTDCVTVCPVNCFHGDDDMLYIDPEVCIDCSACVPECPVHAIHEGEDIPDNLKHWIEINAERAPSLPVIESKQDPLPTAEARRAELGY